MYNKNLYNPLFFQEKSNLRGFLSSINFNGILSSINNGLNIINQSIPIYKQIKPMFNNAKTLIKLVNSFNDNTKQQIKEEDKIIVKEKIEYNNGPVFFI